MYFGAALRSRRQATSTTRASTIASQCRLCRRGRAQVRCATLVTHVFLSQHLVSDTSRAQAFRNYVRGAGRGANAARFVRCHWTSIFRSMRSMAGVGKVGRWLNRDPKSAEVQRLKRNTPKTSIFFMYMQWLVTEQLALAQTRLAHRE